MGLSNSRSDAVHCGVHKITQLTQRRSQTPGGVQSITLGPRTEAKNFESAILIGSSTRMKPNSIIHVERAKAGRTRGSGRPRGFETSPSQSPSLCTQVVAGVFVETMDSLQTKTLPTLYDLRNVGVR